ncbi:two-component hybrid histidine kinase sensor and regulator [Calothrix sp. PCC 7716]|nr:two-component hybrid histidine kinase sensor and regulator [Calothrix sp. PCC 7716]
MDSLQQSDYLFVVERAIPNDLKDIDLILDVTLKPDVIGYESLPVIKVVQSLESVEFSADDFLLYPFSTCELLKRIDLCLRRQSSNLRKLPQYLEMIAHDVYHPLKAVNFVLGLTRTGSYGDSLEQINFAIETSCSTIASTLGVLADLKSQLSQHQYSGKDVEYLNVSTVLRSIHTQFCKTALAQNINFTLLVDPEADDVRLYANGNHIWRMVCNLIVNAFRYTPAGGFVSIKLDAQNRGFLRLSVQDTGVGMAPSQLQQLNFIGIQHCGKAILSPSDYPYSQNRSSAVGIRRRTSTYNGANVTLTRKDTTDVLDQSAGLGLRTVKQVADCYQASVHVSSQIGEGTTFSVIFNLEANIKCYSQFKHLIENTF